MIACVYAIHMYIRTFGYVFCFVIALKYPKLEYKGTPSSSVIRRPHPDVRTVVCVYVSMFVRAYMSV